MGLCSRETGYMCQSVCHAQIFNNRFFKRHTIPNSRSTLDMWRCIMMFEDSIAGLGWRKMCLIWCWDVLSVSRWRLSTWEAEMMLQPLPLPDWNWDYITIDFVMGLTSTCHQIDTMWAIVDRLTKSVHFILIKKISPLIALVRLYRD